MTAPDIKTIILINLITDSVCVLLMFHIWIQNRKRYDGTAFWLLDSILQILALLFIFLRGSIPDWSSLILANAFVATGAWLGFVGLERFVGMKSSKIFNSLVIAAFIVIQFYFSLISPDLDSRNINLSIALIIISIQCSWLLFFKADQAKRQLLTGVGVVYALFVLASLARIVIILLGLDETNDFFKSGAYDAMILISYQVLLILLSFYLVLAVNKRLYYDVRIQEDKFTKAFHSSPYATLMTRMSDGNILEVNDGFISITGYRREEVIGRSTISLNLWAKEEDRISVVSTLGKEKQIRNLELSFRKKSGETFIGQFSADLITIDGLPLILSNIHDITNQKEEELKQKNLLEKIERDRKALISILEDNRRIQESLAESEARYRSIFESANVGKSITLPSGEISVNEAFCRMLGYSQEELFKKKWQDLTPQEEVGSINEILAALVAGEKDTARFEKRYIHKNGNFVWCDLSTVILRKIPGQGPYLITTIVDITEKKKAEAAVQQLNVELEHRVRDRTAQLEASNRELEAFSYSVSHDLRAPLRHIIGFVDLFKGQTADGLSSDGKHYLKVISDSAKSMGILIDNLLQFSRMSRKELQFSEVSMSSLVNEIIDILKNDTPGRTIEWNVRELPEVTGDYSMLRQVWINLLENAVKFTRKKPQAVIDIGCKQEDGRWEFFVRDNGAGFDMKYSAKLFGVFQRLHSLTEFEGTGIGLANVQRIISKHGGSVRADAQPGLGATFYFSIPVKQSDNA